MPSRKEIAAMGPAERELYETAREERAARQRRRTGWRTDATEKEKETALRLAINQMGGGKKYSWLQQGPETVAETLGQQRAKELGIKKGKLAKELKIGEHSGTGDSPQSLTIKWEELRSAGINMTRDEFEKFMRDSGLPEEEVRAAVTPVPEKIVGRSAASARKRSRGGDDAPTTPTETRGRKRGVAADDDGENTTTTAPATKKRRREESTSIPAPATPPKSFSPEASGSSPATKKRRREESASVPALATPLKSSSPEAPGSSPVTKKRRIEESTSVPALATPPKSSPPEAPGSSPANAIEIDIDDEPTFAPPGSSPASAIEVDIDDEPTFAPPSPTVSELEAWLLEEEE
ncbi:hypothetical protein F4824DRAFT_515185 [Ustulina deusta]|nr:hypothetical protein F4824DRAFT_515185 [Ustulina deusta]